jgi:hypothetical protein
MTELEGEHKDRPVDLVVINLVHHGQLRVPQKADFVVKTLKESGSRSLRAPNGLSAE